MLLQWLKTMKSKTAILHRWRQELEEFDFIVNYWPGKSQSHMDALSCLPTGHTEECTLIYLPAEVKDELREWNKKMQNGDPAHQEDVSLEAYSFDNQGHIRVGPKPACHLMEVLHCSIAGHVGTQKTLAVFREQYAAAQDRKIGEDVARHCDGYQMGQDYGHRLVPQGTIAAPRP